MDKKQTIYNLITYFIATVWLVNGLVCKVLNLVPRHQQIVAEILGDDYALPLTKMIGVVEVILAIWIISKFKTQLNSIIQIFLIVVMNILEFLLVPDLLLFGKMNAVLALLFIGLIFLNEFKLKKELGYAA